MGLGSFNRFAYFSFFLWFFLLLFDNFLLLFHVLLLLFFLSSFGSGLAFLTVALPFRIKPSRHFVFSVAWYKHSSFPQFGITVEWLFKAPLYISDIQLQIQAHSTSRIAGHLLSLFHCRDMPLKDHHIFKMALYRYFIFS